MHIRALLLYLVLSLWVTSAFAVPVACGPVEMTASNETSGDLLVDGTPGCLVDIYYCNTDPATYLGTYGLDGSGFINTRIETTSGDCYSANAIGSNNVLGDFTVPYPYIPIPALSWWSLLLMAALIALSGILTSVRNKTRRSNVSVQKT